MVSRGLNISLRGVMVEEVLWALMAMESLCWWDIVGGSCGMGSDGMGEGLESE